MAKYTYPIKELNGEDDVSTWMVKKKQDDAVKNWRLKKMKIEEDGGVKKNEEEEELKQEWVNDGNVDLGFLLFTFLE